MIFNPFLFGLYNLDGTQLLLFMVAIGIAMFAQGRVQSVYAKYKQIPADTNLTGAEIARQILDRHGIHDVQVVPGKGAELSDFYDPKKKIVSLSSNIYNTNSIAAVSVAAHEVGHAIQHATSYSFIALRNRLLPMTIISQNLGMLFVIISSMFLYTSWGYSLFWVGIAMYGVVGLFQLVTLPVEFDASKRALVNLQEMNLVAPDDIDDSKKMLNAAAFTYVAAFLGTIITIIRIVLLFMGGNRRR